MRMIKRIWMRNHPVTKGNKKDSQPHCILFRAELEDGEIISIPWIWTEKDTRTPKKASLMFKSLVENGLNSCCDLIEMLDNEGPYKSEANAKSVAKRKKIYDENELTPSGV